MMTLVPKSYSAFLSKYVEVCFFNVVLNNIFTLGFCFAFLISSPRFFSDTSVFALSTVLLSVNKKVSFEIDLSVNPMKNLGLSNFYNA